MLTLFFYVIYGHAAPLFTAILLESVNLQSLTDLHHLNSAVLAVCKRHGDKTSSSMGTLNN